MASVLYRTSEFHRFGGAASLLAPENEYIRTSGWDAVAEEVSPTQDHEIFQRNLHMLRYGIARPGHARAHRAALAAEAARFLDSVECVDGQLLQVDLVTTRRNCGHFRSRRLSPRSSSGSPTATVAW